MKNLSGLVFRYLAKNKIHSATVILAVTVSALIVFTLFSAGINIDRSSVENAYEESGSWDAVYNVDIGTAREMSCTSEDGSSDNIQYVFINKYHEVSASDAGLLKDLVIISGRLPKSSDELMVSTDVLMHPDEFGFAGYDIKPGGYVIYQRRELVGITEEEFEKRAEELINEARVKAYERVKDTPEFLAELERYEKRHDEGNYDGPDSIYELPSVRTTDEDFAEYYAFCDEYMPVTFVKRRISGIFRSDSTEVLENYIKMCQGFSYSAVYVTVGDKPGDTDEMDNALVIASFKDKSRLYECAEELGKCYRAEPNVNEAALSLYEPSRTVTSYKTYQLYATLLIIVLLFGVVIIVIIRNAFNICVSERESDYGMFRCIGLTRKQIIKMIILEGTILGVAGIVIAILIGVPINKLFIVMANRSPLLYKYISEYSGTKGFIRYHFSAIPFLITGIFMIITVCFSMVASIEKLCRMSPVTALCGRNDIEGDKAVRRLIRANNKKLREAGKKARRPKTKSSGSLVTKLFGYEVGYGFKNIVVRSRRFILSAFTMALGVTLVVAGSVVARTAFNTEYNNQEKPAITLDSENIDTIYGDVRKMDGFHHMDSYVVQHIYNHNPELGEESTNDNNTYIGLSDNYYNMLTSYAELGEMTGEEGVVNVILKKSKYDDELMDKRYDDVQIGDTISVNGKKLYVYGIVEGRAYDHFVYEGMLKGEERMNIPMANEAFIYEYKYDKQLFSKRDNNLKGLGINTSGYGEIYIDYEEYDGAIENYLREASVKYQETGDGIQAVNSIRKLSCVIAVVILIFVTINMINVRCADLDNRREEFRLLRRIGFSRKGIRKSVLSEGGLVSLAAALSGVILGITVGFIISKIEYAGGGFTGSFNDSYMQIRYSINWLMIIISVIIVVSLYYLVGLIAFSHMEKRRKD
ncbi:MAG: ABC transporter permease [Eubacterium sp.]|nr:ABC transporter permease [Eubacterium sp.]